MKISLFFGINYSNKKQQTKSALQVKQSTF